MIRETVTAWPLYWPPGWPRTKYRKPSAFGDSNPFRETQNVLAELGRMGVRSRDIVISSHMKLKPDGTAYARQIIPDHGVAVWFVLKGEERVLACDRWARIEENLHAIALHIAALRGQQRWGVGTAEQAFAGFVALPEQAGGEPWHETLGVSPDASRETIDAAYKRLALLHHPDRGGDRAQWDRLQDVRRIALRARGVVA